ncbi:MAG: hypothetical protein NXH85_11690 [Pseudomonadaceae bacterium]|nr:hypothetical protein [Pseudomonadaceae bacterium]
MLLGSITSRLAACLAFFRTCGMPLLRAASLWLMVGAAGNIAADPVSLTPNLTFAGNVDFTVTAGSLRTQSNAGNSCAVGSTDTQNLSGIPAGSTIVAAYLYWAGSGPTIDSTVTFNGSTVNADRTFTDNYSIGTIDLDFFSGFADVTGIVSGNGSYTFSGLTVTNTNLPGGGTYCANAAVLAGWGLAIIYENASKPLRVINLFDGFQPFRGSQIQLTPSNFVVPASPIDGKIGILSWEGDVENSAAFGGVTENLVFDGESTAVSPLTDGFNPLNNQFNSTVNVNADTNEYGADFDVYDLSSLLRAGDSSATTTYSSGGDLVLLSLQIISVTNTAAADLSIDKSHTGNFSTGAPGAFSLVVSNAGPSTAADASIADTLDANFSYAGFMSTDPNWACSNTGALVTCNHPGPILSGASLAPVEILVNSALAADGATINNTATVSSTTFDPISANNSSTDSVLIVTPSLTASTKSVVDLNGLPTNPGDVLRYTVTLTETNGAAINGAQISDPLDPRLVGPVVTNAAGGTDNTTPTQVLINSLSVAANSSTSIDFEVTVDAGTSDGDVIANTATITNPATGATVNAVAPNVVIGNVPASGIKHLYFGDIGGSQNNPTLPMLMSRTPLTVASAPARVRILRQNNNRRWALSPALQSELTLDGSAMPVVLQMRRSGNNATRNIRVTLSYQQGATTTFIGCQDVSIAGTGSTGLSNAQTRQFVVAVAPGDSACNPGIQAPLTIPLGAELIVAVDNEPNAGFNGQAIFVYPFDVATSRTSRVELPATTVINVDSLATFDAAFPAVTTPSNFGTGESVFLRAVVSDPFGTFDISSVTYRILDPNGTLADSGNLALVQDSGAAIATFEASYTVPAVGPQGLWNIEVTANEGTEGTVSHSIGASFGVFDANVALAKAVRVLSDNVTNTTNPKGIPGAQIEYVITASNLGSLDLDTGSVIIRDTLPAQIRLFLGAPPNPIALVDGAQPSGLTLNFTSLASTTDDVSFSNDGGATFITPLVDGNGFDATVPPINFIEVTPTGTFNGDSGSGPPSFELIFEGRID